MEFHGQQSICFYHRNSYKYNINILITRVSNENNDSLLIKITVNSELFFQSVTNYFYRTYE